MVLWVDDAHDAVISLSPTARPSLPKAVYASRFPPTQRGSQKAHGEYPSYQHLVSAAVDSAAEEARLAPELLLRMFALAFGLLHSLPVDWKKSSQARSLHFIITLLFSIEQTPIK